MSIRRARPRSKAPIAIHSCRACASTATVMSFRSTGPSGSPLWSPAWRSPATMQSAWAPARSANGPMRCRVSWRRPNNVARRKPAPELVRNVRALFGNDRAPPPNVRPIKKCLAVRHVAFEDLGLLGPLVSSRGYGVRYHNAGVQPIDAETLLAPDLLIVLGGPIGVYETDTYPFIAGEIAAIAARLSAGKPTLGICLGAQMMAAALGARVAPGPVKEIGWAPLQ